MDIGGIFTAGFSIVAGVVFSVIAYLLVQRDSQRQLDITKLEALIKETAALVLSENKTTARLVLEEKDKTAKLVLDERDKLAAQLRAEHNNLAERFTDFRIIIAKEYATTELTEKIMSNITDPLVKKLDEIERLLSTKIDRREFERHEAQNKG